jgi:N-acetylmuramoyl-L-alanine amidase
MSMNIPRGKYGRLVFALYMTAFSASVALSAAQAYRLYESVAAYLSPEAVHDRLVKSYDKEKEGILKLASSSQRAAALVARDAHDAALRADEYAKTMEKEAVSADEFLDSCAAANPLGTDSPPVDCSTIQVTDAEPMGEDEMVEIVTDALPKTHLFVNWGHGLNEDGRWRDDGAVADDGTTERSLIMGIAETAYNHAKKSNRLTSVTPVGKEPHPLRDNVNYATDQASRLGCGRPTHKFDTQTVDCYLLSVHANKSSDPGKSGAVAYFNPYSVPSREFAQSLASCLGGVAVSDQNNRHGRLAMVRDVEQVDGVLLETGYMSNTDDLYNLKSGSVGSKVAKCVNAFFDNR